MKTFVILGMHRSATSMVAKGLSDIVHLGDDLLPPAPDNPEGFYENVQFINLNDRILARAGGSWLEPPAENAILEAGQEFLEEIGDLIYDNQVEGEGDNWGWKDPRTTLTIKLFHPFLENPHYIACFRNPLDVGRSIRERSGGAYSVEKGANCAIEYNRRLLEFLAEYHCQYDVSEMNQ